jgi:glutaredoxin-related protein
MKNKFTILNLILLIILFTSSCSKEEIYEVKIFGTDVCGLTSSLKNSCSTDGIAFNYINIDLNFENRKSFYQVVEKYSLAGGGYIRLPVVLMTYKNKTSGIEGASIQQVKAFISK